MVSSRPGRLGADEHYFNLYKLSRCARSRRSCEETVEGQLDFTRNRSTARFGERAMIMAFFFALYMTQKSDTCAIHLILCATAA